MVELTGDSQPDIGLLNSADILCTTPEKWDGISRNWQNRGYVRDVALLILDEIHLLGNDRGPILEVCSTHTDPCAQQSATRRLHGLRQPPATPPPPPRVLLMLTKHEPVVRRIETVNKNGGVNKMHGLDMCVIVLQFFFCSLVHCANQPDNDGEPLSKKQCSSKQLSLKTFFKPQNTN